MLAAQRLNKRHKIRAADISLITSYVPQHMPFIEGTSSDFIDMEREVSDTEGVFSRRLISNWAELPTTLRRRQKHRPDILNQFTDYSESSESELHKFEPRPVSNVQRMRRSEFMRKWESKDLGPKNYFDPRKETRKHRPSTAENFWNRLDENCWKHYENQAYRKKMNFISKQEVRNFSDEDRKTNSPDSLLMKSSESELSSDEYGHTDDSGAFLEQASHLDKVSKSRKSSFIKFFAKDSNKEKKKLDSDYLDVNKNIRQSPESLKKEHFSQQKFEYENIPRIDVSKLDQKSFLHPIARTNVDRQMLTIEQLRIEEGCELRNSKNATDATNARETKQQKSKDEETKTSNMIQEFYEDEQMMQSIGGERKMAKMETITEENNTDNSKLSVREILKRFEELRTQSDSLTPCNENETQTEEKANDKTLNTIQETLKKLDEKVKNYQVYLSYLIIAICVSRNIDYSTENYLAGNNYKYYLIVLGENFFFFSRLM